MIKKIYALSLMLLFVSILPTVAQKNEQAQEFVKFETPTVASFTKFIEHPVNLYNGNPDITVPIYTLKDGAIQIPLALRYNASGIKVSEEASWVGLGWNLNAGGVIVQNCVGKEDIPDRFKQDLDYYPPGEFNYYSGINYRATDKSQRSTFFFYANEGHLEPDVFSFSFPRYSGKFFIDYRDNTIHQINSEKPVKIRKSNSGWTITTETGIEHIFQLAQKTYVVGSASPSTITFYLTDSVYPNGQKVHYEYDSSTIYGHCLSENQTLTMTPPPSMVRFNPYSEVFLNTRVIKATELTLKSIQTDNYKINFITSTRQDLLNGKKLDEITISELNNNWNLTPKRFKLLYDYFVSPVPPTGNYWKVISIQEYSFNMERNRRRLKLLSTHEIIGTSTVHNKYSFDYNSSIQLPVKTSFATDYWGYYNGKINNTSSIPDFKLLLGDKDQGISDKQGRKADRSYDYESCKAGSLKRVNYPTGGYSEFNYEPHQFKSNINTPPNEEKTFICKIFDDNSSSTTTNYDLRIYEPTNISINLLLSKGLNSWADMQGSSCVLMNGSNLLMNDKFDVSNASASSTNIKKIIDKKLAPGSYRLIVSIPDRLGNQNGANLNHGRLEAEVYKISTTIPETGYSIGAGLRINKIDFMEISSATKPVYTVEYEYPDPSANGILSTKLEFNRHNRRVSYAVYQPHPTASRIIEFEQHEVEISGNNFMSTPYSTNGGAVGYSTVKEKVTGEIQNGYKIYKFSNTAEVASSSSVQIPNTSNGILRSVSSYKKDGTLVKSETYTYQSNRKHHFRGVTIIDNFNRSPQFYNQTGQYLIERDPDYELLDLGAYDGRYTILLYAVNSYENRMTSKTTTIDGVTTKETYGYNSHGLLNKTTLTQSNGKSNVNQITYPTDYSCGVYQTMQTKNMLAFPVEERSYTNNNLTGGKLTQYSVNGSNAVPASISLAVVPESGNPTGFSCSGVVSAVYPYKNTEILKYDSRSNPVNIVSNGTENIIFIWGYNYQYPIAKIEGVSYNDVKTALNNVAPESLSSAIVPDMVKVDGLRAKLPKALITTYTYKPLTGIQTITQPNGEKVTFEYDSYGRLSQTKDHYGYKIEDYQYNYRP